MQEGEQVLGRADEGCFAVGEAGGGEPGSVGGQGGLLRVAGQDGVGVVRGEMGVVVGEEGGDVLGGGGVGGEDGAFWEGGIGGVSLGFRLLWQRQHSALTVRGSAKQHRHPDKLAVLEQAIGQVPQ